MYMDMANSVDRGWTFWNNFLKSGEPIGRKRVLGISPDFACLASHASTAKSAESLESFPDLG